jgi:NADH-quinone oxidoreductase subunit M
VGAAIALFAGKHARGVALSYDLCQPGAGAVCLDAVPATGRLAGGTAAWAPSLGIEYHLGVDGLGALMLVLSAIVTLMSVDAAHRVHHQPGLYFGWCWCWSRGSSGRSRR